MANLIDSSYFIRELSIPNIDNSISNRNAPSLDALNSYIKRYEPECIEMILGYPLAKKLSEEYRFGEENGGPSSTERMRNLVEGCDFDLGDGSAMRWKGLVYEPKVSLLANYVFFKWEKNDATKNTGINTSVPSTENLPSVSPVDRMVAAWNFFSEEVENLVVFLVSNMDVYPEYDDSYAMNALRLSRKINKFGI